MWRNKKTTLAKKNFVYNFFLLFCLIIKGNIKLAKFTTHFNSSCCCLNFQQQTQGLCIGEIKQFICICIVWLFVCFILGMNRHFCEREREKVRVCMLINIYCSLKKKIIITKNDCSKIIKWEMLQINYIQLIPNSTWLQYFTTL